ncbi:MAG: hypothetical protein WBD33_01175, partial [Xanthobacteraceae bacterium]
MNLSSLSIVLEDHGAAAVQPVKRATGLLGRLAMIFAAMVVVLAVGTSPSAASDYYVNGQTGSNSNQGTSSAPFRSFGRAV